MLAFILWGLRNAIIRNFDVSIFLLVRSNSWYKYELIINNNKKKKKKKKKIKKKKKKKKKSLTGKTVSFNLRYTNLV